MSSKSSFSSTTARSYALALYELSKDFKSALNIDYEYNPDLIGGLIIQVGSVMVDTSIKTKLKKLEKNMLEA